MSKKLYVSNLAFAMSDSTLEELFGSVGQVVSAKVITDRDTGRSKGFGFVELDDEAAQKAIKALDGSDYEGRRLGVSIARPREDRPNDSSNRGDFNKNRY